MAWGFLRMIDWAKGESEPRGWSRVAYFFTSHCFEVGVHHDIRGFLIFWVFGKNMAMKSMN